MHTAALGERVSELAAGTADAALGQMPLQTDALVVGIVQLLPHGELLTGDALVLVRPLPIGRGWIRGQVGLEEGELGVARVCADARNVLDSANNYMNFSEIAIMMKSGTYERSQYQSHRLAPS